MTNTNIPLSTDSLIAALSAQSTSVEPLKSLQKRALPLLLISLFLLPIMVVVEANYGIPHQLWFFAGIVLAWGSWASALTGLLKAAYPEENPRKYALLSSGLLLLWIVLLSIVAIQADAGMPFTMKWAIQCAVTMLAFSSIPAYLMLKEGKKAFMPMRRSYVTLFTLAVLSLGASCATMVMAAQGLDITALMLHIILMIGESILFAGIALAVFRKS